MASSDLFNNFNLIPPRSKEELGVLEERENSIIYSFFLIFFGMLVFFMLTLAQALVIEPRIEITRVNIEQKKVEAETYNNIKELNGELFIKAKALEPILAKDIKITQLLDISEQIQEDVVASEVINYQREVQGDFIITLSLQDYQDINQIIENTKGIEVLKNVFIRSMSRNANKVNAVISFNISNING